MPRATADGLGSPDFELEVTEALLAFLADERAALAPEAEPLLDQIEALVRAGGKRLRPRFCYWGFVAGGGSPGPELVRTAAALELLHTFALILDDVMDASPVRRHRSTVSRTLAFAGAATGRGDAGRFGASAAVLAALVGLVLADRLLWSAGFPPDVAAAAARRFDDMRLRTIAGQYLDIDAARLGGADEITARRIGELKTAGYTVADPLAIGALSAGAGERVVAALEAFGIPLGEAFQIRDDLLGALGDPGDTGKDRDGDLREGKQTVVLAKARALASPEDGAFLDAAVGDPALSAADAERVRNLMRSTGAAAEAAALADELTGRAIAALDEEALGPRAAAALAALAAELAGRTS